MINLTEQWKKGELINGKKYYITFFDSEPFEATFRTFEAMIPYWKFEANGKQYCDENGYDCVKVLAEVPSYEELQNQAFILKSRESEIVKLKERICEFAEANQSLRKQLDEERAKNRIDYYNGSPMDFLDECERDRKKNKIYKNWINNIREELIISDLRRTDEGNKFIVNLLSKINQVLGEE